MKGHLYLSEISVEITTLEAFIPKCETRFSFHNLSISVLKVGRQLAGSLAVAAFFMCFLTSCIKEENPVQPHEQGNLTTRAISMSSDYLYQVFYNLDKDSVISRNERFDWDLAFESATEGGSVRVNQSKFMSAWISNDNQLEQRSDTSGLWKKMKPDRSNTQDTVAIGKADHCINKIIYIDMGYDRYGELIGLRKLQVLDNSPTSYKIKHSNINGTDIKYAEIQKDTNYNSQFFSFNKNTTVKVEPPKKDWDLVFTQYVHQFYDPFQAYLVTGVLLNSFNTVAGKDSTNNFTAINRAMTESYEVSNRADVIGYDWKTYMNNVYTIRPRVNYVIRDSKGYWYKLHFIDFYDNKGTKGFPKFEYQKL